VSQRFRDRTGDVLGDRYELLAVLGHGGQSAVYRARDRRDGDEVAVKVLLPNTDPGSVERMYREAQAMSSLAGTAAVRVLHQIREPDGTMALVMELLRGCDLLEYLERHEARGERVSIARLAEIAEPLVATLEAAHGHGIVHRDLKPPNVWIIDEAHGGGVRLLDFGFAKLSRSVPITGIDDIAGTPTFIAPEVFLQGSSKADARADVYSLAVLFYRVLAGRVPFEGGSMVDLLRKVTTGPRPSLHALRPDLPAAVDEWVVQALAVDRTLRFERVRAMWNALYACLKGA
jgi:eukaryotic-like serine/threonine-protein kinase